MASADTSMPTWYLVYTKPRQEQMALEHLQRQGYHCYLPTLRTEKIRRGKAVWVTEALFPRYLFIRLETGLSAKSWSPIRSTQGVSTLVHFGSQPARVDDALVQWLQQHEQALPEQARFQPGDAVRITRGPFAGLDALYQMTDAQQRAIVLIDILSRPVQLPIEPAALEANR